MFKYKGKSKTIGASNYNNRKDKHRFSYFASHLNSSKHALQFSVFNFLFDDMWLYDSFASANDKYMEKYKFYSTFVKNIAEDYTTISVLMQNKQVTLKTLFAETHSGCPPPIFQLLWRHDISIEFISLSNHIYNFFNTSTKYKDPLVKEEVKKICNYTPFVLLFRK